MTNNHAVLNAASIEIAKTKESMDLLYIYQLQWLQNRINLFRVHFDLTMWDNHSKEVNFCDSEATLFGFDK